MHVGTTLRNMGDQSTPGTMSVCALAAEQAGLESIWVVDHIAIPPGNAEGSNGRYVDPLVSLAWLAGITTRIRLGVGVLILPYRPPVPTAKQLASIQELSGGRLLFGAGIGWMDPEFRALGVDRHRRGRLADDALAFIRACFDNDEVTANGQTFLFRPRPVRPPIYVGGSPPHALKRAAKFGDGWLPVGMTPERLPKARAEYAEVCDAAGKPLGEIVVMGGLPLRDRGAAAQALNDFREAGAARFVLGGRYADSDEYRRTVEGLAAAVGAL
ncbi:MAG: TIGR03619 family F420-dependent LLM class oxidoreductase [Gammaproteobacteria bacterium]|nr:TIGR03619 family F420-dependent LLM class oxidoreductase [Gammaproteobacteria bacterium]MDE0443658.1 TIGR03619 family F420-dependent LLM class oxidoreductase [Gammaproteobacteria bacterium]